MESVRRHKTLGPIPLWTLLLAGPLAWGVRLVASYVVIAVACAEGLVGPDVLGLPVLTHVLLGMTAVFLLVCLAAAVFSWWAWRLARRHARVGVDEQVNWTSTMALLALFLNGFFFFVTLGEGVAILFFHPCA